MIAAIIFFTDKALRREEQICIMSRMGCTCETIGTDKIIHT